MLDGHCYLPSRIRKHDIFNFVASPVNARLNVFFEIFNFLNIGLSIGWFELFADVEYSSINKGRHFKRYCYISLDNVFFFLIIGIKFLIDLEFKVIAKSSRYTEHT